MSTKVATRTRKVKASKAAQAKTSKKTKSITKATVSRKRKPSVKDSVKSSNVSVKFVPTKSGRIVKSSPATPRLGNERIEMAVRNFIQRDEKTAKFSD